MATHDGDNQWRVNPGYVVGQLMRALETAATHPDAATRGRAQAKAGTWRAVINRMLSGALKPGSRTPVKDTPVWVTLQVAKGGFATGELAAEGPPLAHETILASRLGLAVDRGLRSRLNAYYLTPPGRAELEQMLATGRYQIDVPEEAALLTVVWLMGRQEPAAARDLLREIEPWIGRLRFYPASHDGRPPVDTGLVRLRTIGQVRAELAAIRVPADILDMRETLTVWKPMGDRLVALAHETVRGEPPRLGLPRAADGRTVVDGGWPFQVYPDGWHARAREILAEIARLRETHARCGRPESPRTNFGALRRVIRLAVETPERLTGRDVGLVRCILAQVRARRGLPASAELAALRAADLAMAQRTTKADLARVVMARLSPLPEGRGLADPATMLRPVTPEEASRHRVPAGLAVASAGAEPGWVGLGAIVERAREASAEALIERGIVGSAEVLATLVPQLSSRAVAASATDPALRRLIGATYEAFRRRRTLLLLDLQSQVRFGELPWVRATAHARAGSSGTRGAAGELLEMVARLTLTGFPATIVPNRMVRELDALARAAGPAIPFTEELAADIFMGDVTAKFLDAAKLAAGLMAGTLYERYYGLSYADVLRLAVVEEQPGGRRTAPGLVEMCRELAGLPADGNRSVARNGRIIEQIQIVTTHNLAAMVGPVGLQAGLATHFASLAGRCLEVCVSELARPLPDGHSAHHTRLIRRKHAAYAWRQMVFFLAMLDAAGREQALAQARTTMAAAAEPARLMLAPCLEGVAASAGGGALAPADPRRFLGWV